MSIKNKSIKRVLFPKSMVALHVGLSLLLITGCSKSAGKYNVRDAPTKLNREKTSKTEKRGLEKAINKLEYSSFLKLMDIHTTRDRLVLHEFFKNINAYQAKLMHFYEKHPLGVYTKILDNFIAHDSKSLYKEDGDGYNPLYWAVQTLNIQEPYAKVLFERLLRHYNAGDMNLSNSSGYRPLHLAAMHSKCPEIIEVLVEKGADVNAIDNDGYRPLHLAAMHNECPEIVHVLVEQDAEVNVRDHAGKTPLHLAAMHSKCPEIVQVLVEQDAEVNVKDHAGKTPLHLAAMYSKCREIVQLLIVAQAEVNVTDNKGKTPLHLAAMYSKDREIVHLLIDAGTEVNIIDNEGKTPLHLAAMFSKDPEIVQVLVEQGAQVNVRDHEQNTPLLLTLHALGVSANTKTLAIIQQVIEEDPQVSLLGSWRDSLLSMTTMHKSLQHNKYPEIARLLIDAGAEVNVTDDEGETPLFIALNTQTRQTAIVRLLIEADAEVNVRDHAGKTPLLLAIYKGYRPEIVEALLAKGAQVNVTDSEGNTPLLLASSINKHPTIVQLLVNKGAQV